VPLTRLARAERDDETGWHATVACCTLPVQTSSTRAFAGSGVSSRGFVGSESELHAEVPRSTPRRAEACRREDLKGNELIVWERSISVWKCVRTP
jgi:hypothetical protein